MAYTGISELDLLDQGYQEAMGEEQKGGVAVSSPQPPLEQPAGEKSPIVPPGVF
jgi:hypothetical protein